MHNDKEEVKVKRGILDRILAKAGFKALEDVKIVDMVVTAADGSELTIERESGDPQVGDTATPDGSFVMEDGTTIVVADGVITEIIPPVSGDEETEALREENKRLKEEIASLKEQLGISDSKAKTEEESAILAKVNNAGGKAWLDKILSMKSSHTVLPARWDVRETTSNETPTQRALRDLKEKIENNKK